MACSIPEFAKYVSNRLMNLTFHRWNCLYLVMVGSLSWTKMLRLMSLVMGFLLPLLVCVDDADITEWCDDVDIIEWREETDMRDNPPRLSMDRLPFRWEGAMPDAFRELLVVSSSTNAIDTIVDICYWY